MVHSRSPRRCCWTSYRARCAHTAPAHWAHFPREPDRQPPAGALREASLPDQAWDQSNGRRNNRRRPRLWVRILVSRARGLGEKRWFPGDSRRAHQPARRAGAGAPALPGGPLVLTQPEAHRPGDGSVLCCSASNCFLFSSTVRPNCSPLSVLN